MCMPDSPKSYLTSEVSRFTNRKWPSFHREYLLCQVLQQTWLACLLQPCDYPGPGNECGEMKLGREQREQTTRPLSQPQFRYFRPFRIFLKIWTQRLICTPPLSSLHSSARLVMQPAMGGEGGVRETCGSSRQSWCSYNVNNSKIYFTDTDTDKEEKRKQFGFGNFLSTIILTS